MKYYRLIRKWAHELSQYRISLFAANASFYIILSVFPTIMLLVSLLPSFGITTKDLWDAMEGLIPTVIYPLIEQIFRDLEEASAGMLLSTTAPIAIWSASGGIYCIRKGLNHIYGIREIDSFLKNRFSSMMYTILLIMALILTLILNGFGRSLIAYMAKQHIPIVNFFSKILRIRSLILIAVLTGLFSTMYCLFPTKKRGFRFALPGATLAAFGWLIFTEGYSLYVRFSGSYSILYGSLSVIAMGMVWLYVCISILFYGCILNIYLEHR